jgi:hypothetical protein
MPRACAGSFSWSTAYICVPGSLASAATPRFAGFFWPAEEPISAQNASGKSSRYGFLNSSPFSLPDYKKKSRARLGKLMKIKDEMNGPSIADSRVPVMYRLPYIGKPRTAGSGKSHRQSSGPEKGKPAGQPAEGAADNRRPLHSGGQWQCKTKTLLHLEQRFVHCGNPGMDSGAPSIRHSANSAL